MDESRSAFMRNSAEAAAGTTAADRLHACVAPERVLGANDHVRVAICGLQCSMCLVGAENTL